MFNKIWNILLKLFFSSIISSLLSSGFLASLSKLATYNYSKYYKIRFPLEGIPYLKDAIFYGGFILILIIVFSLTYTIFISSIIAKKLPSALNKVKKIIERLSDYSDHKETIVLMEILMSEKHPIKKRVSVCILMSLAFSVLLYISLGQERSLTQLLITFFILLFVFLYSLIIPNKNFVWINVITSALITFVFTFGVIFYPPFYAELLRLCRYGGGSSVTLIVNVSENNKTQEYNGSLLLRTLDSYIFYDTKDKQIKEFRINNSVITYPFNSASKYYLPR